jgi:dTMP kinase
MSKFIVIEGIDGAGIETQSRMLIDFLKKKGIGVESIDYPGYDNPVGKFIKDFLYKKFDLIPDVQALLYAADMINDKEKIKNSLKQGRYVIGTRYFTSTLAYQGLNGVPRERLLKFADLFEMPKPELVIYLRISPETSVSRKKKEKKNAIDRFESDKEYLKRVDESYDYLIKNNVFSNWYVIDGEKPKEDVFEQVKRVLRLG